MNLLHAQRGVGTRYSAIASAILLAIFAVALSTSVGIKKAFNFSVFTASAAAMLLALSPTYEWSVDAILHRGKTINGYLLVSTLRLRHELERSDFDTGALRKRSKARESERELTARVTQLECENCKLQRKIARLELFNVQ